VVDIAYFFGGIVGMLLDPLIVGGCFIAGFVMKKYWAALTGGVIWVLLLQIAIVIPSVKETQGNYPPMIMVYAVIAALIATSLAFGIVSFFRRRREQNSVADSDATDD